MWTRARPLFALHARIACRHIFFSLSPLYSFTLGRPVYSYANDVVPYDWNFRSLTVICAERMEQYHREHNNVFLCVTLARHVNTQSNQVDLWAYHSSTLHTLTRTHARLHRFFIPLTLNCYWCCCCIPKYTHAEQKEQPRHTDWSVCLGCFAISNEANANENNYVIEMGKCKWQWLDFPWKIYMAMIIFNGVFSTLSLSSMLNVCSRRLKRNDHCWLSFSCYHLLSVLFISRCYIVTIESQIEIHRI